MKLWQSIYALTAALVLPMTVKAQTILADFETVQPTAIGAYDYYWPQSPFATGALQPNVAVVANPYVAYGNESTHVLGFQRSRYAGNLFGAKIVLQEPFELTPTTKYVHVMLNRPITSGRVGLIGLGKRTDRPEQSDQVVQFVRVVEPTIVPNEWKDIVFAVKGNGGIAISSLVVVPQAENTSEMTEDFIAYIDNIEINNDPKPRYRKGDYLVNFEDGDSLTRRDRKITAIGFTGNKGGKFSATLNGAPYLYRYTDSVAWARPGETITPSISYQGNWMHSYVYLDLGKDGNFTIDTLNNVPTATSDLKSYSYLNGYNSHGTKLANANPGVTPPTFVIPAGTPHGIYRMRYKVDWNEADAGGNATDRNNTKQNGGGMIDVSLNIHGETSRVTIDNRNGEVVRADSSILSDTEVPFGQDLEIVMVPAPGFKQNGIIIRHGYLGGDSLVHGTPQYRDTHIPAYAFVNNRFTIPGYLVDGDLRITVEFAEKKDDTPNQTEAYTVNFDKATSQVTRTDRKTSGAGISILGGKTYTFAIDSVAPYPVYVDATNNKVFAKAGQDITPFIRYTGSSMHTYCYIDYNQNGQFDISGDASNELVSYSYHQGVNSQGASVPPLTMAAPTFRLPSYLPNGVYRARLKLDWNDINPGGRGNNVTENRTADNGGRIIDFLISIQNSGSASLYYDSYNGSIYSPKGLALPNSIVSGSELIVKPTPVAKGYILNELYVKSGINFSGPASIHGNRQWGIDTIPVSHLGTNLTCTIPGNRVDGEVIVTAKFVATPEASYKLVWSDEFNAANGTLPNTDKWGHATRYHSAWNRYIASSWDSVAYHDNGTLLLRAIPKPDNVTDTVPFITGAVTSSGKFSYLYGKLEARALFKPLLGNFPAIWLLGQAKLPWPERGEIDIVEQINTTHTAHQTIHTAYTSSIKRNNTPPAVFSKNIDMTKYHTYGLEWTPDTLRWYIDGQLTATYPRVPERATEGQWPFDKHFYIILNQSVGNGGWASNPIPGYKYETRIDWVRVYQMPHSTNIAATTQNTNNITFHTGKGAITLTSVIPQPVTISDVAGRTHLHEHAFSGTHTLYIPSGVYIVNGKKVIVP
ncbi:MAG: glycoside hydrolase family 16 protein [Bacteroidales bacterium]|nr:glycoside hydrolase family 16 protein [Bacteroidales bacterium]